MFARADEADDALFYETNRLVQHLDEEALRTVSEVIGRVVTHPSPDILDLMASHDSHLPAGLNPGTVTGLGLNERELAANQALTDFVLHDLNREPALPFAEDSFDAVICTVSVDYMTKPVEVFRDVRRVLRPGGVFLVIFSNRFFPQKVVKVWEELSEDERVILVKEYFERAGVYGDTRIFVSRGKPRPESDKYASAGIASDPVYAVFAQAAGEPAVEVAALADAETVAARKERVGETLRCPYCQSGLRKWEVPQHIWTEWPNDFLYVCMNDDCPYFVRGWDVMERQGASGSYRLMFDPLNGSCEPIPVLTNSMLRDGIIE